MKILRHGSDHPLVSICVPTLDRRQESVDRLEASLVKWTTINYEMVIVDCEHEPLGYSIPQNAAIRAARSDVVVAANDDVIIRGPWTFPMLSALEDGAWCVTPDMTHTDGPQVFAPYFMMWWRDRWDRLGGLDEHFVYWGSDIDLARRLIDAGHPPVRVQLPVPIRHEGSEATRKRPESAPDLSAVALDDLRRFAKKWGTTAEQEKSRLIQFAL